MTLFHNSLCYRDSRELAFQQLQHALTAKDFELAKLQQSQSQLFTEVTELRKVNKREGVNMDYLKNIILQVCLPLVFYL